MIIRPTPSGLPTLNPAARREATTPRNRPLPAVACLAALLWALPAAGQDNPIAQTYQPSVAGNTPVTQRLARWDNDTEQFVPVTPDSINSGHVYVVTHGWSPDYKAAVDAYPGPGPLMIWQPQAQDSGGRRFTDWLIPTAAVIAQRDPLAEVLVYSWLDDAATTTNPLEASISLARTDVNGQRLGQALDFVLADDFRANGGRLHLIGPSHGAKVATMAALSFPRGADHLTILDAPEITLTQIAGAATNLGPYLRQLNIGRGPGQTFVDNYYSFLGMPYNRQPGLSEIVDVQLEPLQYLSLDVAGRHIYPIFWYLRATQSNPDLALGWSPLIDPEATAELARNYRQAWRTVNNAYNPAAEFDVLASTGEAVVSDLTSLPLPFTQRNTQGTAVDENGTVTLVESEVALFDGTFIKTPEDTAIEMDYEFTRPGTGGTELAVFFNNQLQFSMDSQATSGGKHTAVMDISDLSNGPHQVTVGLFLQGTPDTTVEVTAFRLLRKSGFSGVEDVSVPGYQGLMQCGAPGALTPAVALAGVGLLLIARRRRRAQEVPSSN